jgi:hypothetical protein
MKYLKFLPLVAVLLIFNSCKKDKSEEESQESKLSTTKWTNIGVVPAFAIPTGKNYSLSVVDTKGNFLLANVYHIFKIDNEQNVSPCYDIIHKALPFFSVEYNYSFERDFIYPMYVSKSNGSQILNMNEYTFSPDGIMQAYESYYGNTLFGDAGDSSLFAYHSCTGYSIKEGVYGMKAFLRAKHTLSGDSMFINDMNDSIPVPIRIAFAIDGQVTGKDSYFNLFKTHDGYLIQNNVSGPAYFISPDGTVAKKDQLTGRITKLGGIQIVYADANGIYQYNEGGTFMATPFYNGPLTIRSAGIMDDVTLGYDNKAKAIVYINNKTLSVIKTKADNLDGLFDGQTEFPYIEKVGNKLFFIKYSTIYMKLEE